MIYLSNQMSYHLRRFRFVWSLILLKVIIFVPFALLHHVHISLTYIHHLLSGISEGIYLKESEEMWTMRIFDRR